MDPMLQYTVSWKEDAQTVVFLTSPLAPGRGLKDEEDSETGIELTTKPTLRSGTESIG